MRTSGRQADNGAVTPGATVRQGAFERQAEVDMGSWNWRDETHMEPFRLVRREILERLLAPWRQVAPETEGLGETWPDALLTLAPSELPGDLLELLRQIDDLATEAGHARLLSLCREGGIDPGSLAELDPRSAACLAWLEHRNVFQQAWDVSFVENLDNFRVFAAPAHAHTTPATLTLGRMEFELGRAFAQRGRTAYCRIRCWSWGERTCFLIARGQVRRVEAALDDAASEAQHAWRPRLWEAVVWDPSTRQLQVRAGDRPTLDLYRERFGAHLLGDEAAFSEERLISLDPLVQHREMALEITPGLDEVTLTSLQVALTDRHHGRLTIDGKDVFLVLERLKMDASTLGSLAQATFKVRFEGSRRQRRVEIRPPNQLIFDRRAHRDVVEGFLLARGFLRRTPAIG